VRVAEVRRAWLAPVLIAAALLLQLTVLNGLRLPGGGGPDLVLVLVAALALAQGPLAGAIIGFAAGLCLDLAPPDVGLIGQYALVFCLAGWAAGRLQRIASQSPLLAAALMAVVVVVAESLSAVLGLMLQPAQVSAAAVRSVLPATLGYDLLISPFVLYLVMLASMLLAGGLRGQAAGQALAGAATAHRPAGRQPRRHEPRLRQAAARTGDGWVGNRAGSSPGLHPGARPRARQARLRPAAGVAGSASGLVRHPGQPAGPVHLRLAAGRRHDGSIGNAVGTGLRQPWSPGRHPGSLAGRSGQFRPHPAAGGSAVRRPGLTGPGGLTRPRTTIKFGGRSGGIAGRPGTGGGPRVRTGASRSALALARPGRGPASVIPKVRFGGSSAPVVRRAAATPRFRRRSAPLRPASAAFGVVSGGVLSQSTFRAAGGRPGSPRLRLGRSRPGTGMLGGGRVTMLGRPASRIGKQPRFGYGRRSVLSFLTGRRIGGHWLARKRVGGRSGVWVISKRTGGAR
jgi:rod shape-determining protein MreD